jgi:hypothetical protein
VEQSDVFVALGAQAARDTAGRRAFAIDLREGDHWVQLAGFFTRSDARAALVNAVRAGVDPEGLRVRKRRAERSR